MRKKVVILYSHLSDYMINIFEYWVKVSGVDLYIYRKKIDSTEAPYEFANVSDNIYFFDESNFNKSSLLKDVVDIDPAMIICAGWMDSRYLKTVKHFSKKIPTILTMDTIYAGTFRQKLGIIFSQFLLINKFSHVLVPGNKQANFAKMLGFNKSQIVQGLYVANEKNFLRDLINPNKIFTKRFIFLGRYMHFKGVNDLWDSFVDLQKESPNDWKLVCIGTGPLFEKRNIHPSITHLGFVQPNNLKEHISQGGVFILPSHYEPWGVVVHEFAHAGFPLILSDAVGAKSAFLDENNGYVFKSGDKESLKLAMKRMMEHSSTDLAAMGEESYNLAKKINKENWVLTINSILNKLNNGQKNE